jgi:hypothetical protein
MHRALNIDEKKLITQFGRKLRDEIQTKMLHLYMHRALNIDKKKTNYTVW